MRFRFLFSVLAAAVLSACGGTITTTVPGQPSGTGSQSQAQAPTPRVGSQRAIAAFAEVVQTVEPVAERECRARTRGVSCDFRILVDDRPGVPANAFQTLDKSGRPIIAFTLALIEDARNTDELAFVMGHEAAHHIAGHIPRQQQNAVVGAILSGTTAILLGASPEAVESAQRAGMQVGARTFSKNFELEADALGTVITARAGYDPLRGAEFFNRIPDPGDRFLGTHPPNAQRLETVRRTAAGL